MKDETEQVRHDQALVEAEIDRRIKGIEANMSQGYASLHEYIDGQIQVLTQRLDDIDKATELLNQTVTRTPTEITKQIAHLKELTNSQFKNDKVAVDAAFAAQKEAVFQQNTANQLAINKSEANTVESINKLGELFSETISGVNQKIDALKSSRDTGEGKTTGIDKTIALLIAGISILFGIVGVATALLK